MQDLINQGAIFYCSHSGGKDSQAMYSYLKELVPHDQIVVIHADLGHVEHTGVQEHIKENITHPLNVVRAVWKDGSSKDLLSYVRHRKRVRPDAPSWPSSASRWCTSELKTSPIYKFIRNHMKLNGFTLAVNCMGLRAEESPARAKKHSWSTNTNLSKAGRMVYDWLPIHDWNTSEVFQEISNAGQDPHPAYLEGNERLSCVFCIMGSPNDLSQGAKARPDLFQEYLNLEKEVGYTMFHKQSLEEKVINFRRING